MKLNIKFNIIPFINFCSWAVIIFVSHTDRYFVKIVKSCAGNPKNINQLKNGCLKFLGFHHFLLILYKEESCKFPNIVLILNFFL